MRDKGKAVVLHTLVYVSMSLFCVFITHFHKVNSGLFLGDGLALYGYSWGHVQA